MAGSDAGDGLGELLDELQQDSADLDELLESPVLDVDELLSSDDRLGELLDEVTDGGD
mgnify:CR=1 FL=1